MQELPSPPQGLLTPNGWTKASADFSEYGDEVTETNKRLIGGIADLNKAWGKVPWDSFSASGITDPGEIDELTKKAAADWKKHAGNLTRKVALVVKVAEQVSKCVKNDPGSEGNVAKLKAKHQKQLSDLIEAANDARESISGSFDDEDFKELKEKFLKERGMAAALPGDSFQAIQKEIGVLAGLAVRIESRIKLMGKTADVSCEIVERYDEAFRKKDDGAEAGDLGKEIKTLDAEINRLQSEIKMILDLLDDVGESLQGMDDAMEEVAQGGEKVVGRFKKQAARAKQHCDKVTQMIERAKPLVKLLQNAKKIMAAEKSVEKVSLPDVDVSPVLKEATKLTAVVKGLKSMK